MLGKQNMYCSRDVCKKKKLTSEEEVLQRCWVNKICTAPEMYVKKKKLTSEEEVLQRCMVISLHLRSWGSSIRYRIARRRLSASIRSFNLKLETKPVL